MRTAKIANPIEISGVREDVEDSSSDERSQGIIISESQVGKAIGKHRIGNTLSPFTPTTIKQIHDEENEKLHEDFL